MKGEKDPDVKKVSSYFCLKQIYGNYVSEVEEFFTLPRGFLCS